MKYPVVQVQEIKKDGKYFFDVYYDFEHIEAYPQHEEETKQTQALQEALNTFVFHMMNIPTIQKVSDKYYMIHKDTVEMDIKKLAQYMMEMLMESGYVFEQDYGYVLHIQIQEDMSPLVLGMNRKKKVKDGSENKDKLVFLPIEDIQFRGKN